MGSCVGLSFSSFAFKLQLDHPYMDMEYIYIPIRGYAAQSLASKDRRIVYPYHSTHMHLLMSKDAAPSLACSECHESTKMVDLSSWEQLFFVVKLDMTFDIFFCCRISCQQVERSCSISDDRRRSIRLILIWLRTMRKREIALTWQKMLLLHHNHSLSLSKIISYSAHIFFHAAL